MRSRLAEEARCDLPLHFVPALLDEHGRLHLHSADPAQPIAIHALYLSDPEGNDLKRMIEAAQVSREILDQHALDAYRGEPVS